jgi:hypothetical protein
MERPASNHDASDLPAMARDAPPRTIFCYPDRPAPTHMLEYMRQAAGWDYASGPETADWCVLNQDVTWLRLPEDDPWAEASWTWINGRCRDISKRTVQRTFAEVFGYPLAIDPLTYQGVCLRKNNRNYVKDAVMLQCPIPPSELDDQYVYERLIESRLPALGVLELLRVSVVDRNIASVSRKIHPDWISSGPLDESTIDLEIVYPASVFTPMERTQLAAYCDAMALDFGSLDVLRDIAGDGRIYVVDTNTSPSYHHVDEGITARDRLRMEQVLQAFCERFPPHSASTAPATVGLAPKWAPGNVDRANEWQDWADSIAARIDAQTERIARLEAALQEWGDTATQVSADFSRLLKSAGAASKASPRPSGKKKRKK